MRDPLASAAEMRPGSMALDTGHETLTYQDLDARAEEVARHLLGSGVRPGSTVATLVPEGPRMVTATWGILRAGCNLSPLHPERTDRELIDQLDVVRPDLVVCTGETERQAGFVTQAPPLVTLDSAGPTRAMPLHELPLGDQPAGGAQADTLCIVSTSGTSGRPQAAELRLSSLVHVAHACRDRLGLSTGDRWLYTLSAAHIGGLATVVRTAVTGSTLVHRGAFHAPTLNRLLDEGSVTHASLVPTMLHQVLEDRGQKPAPGTVACLLLGGAATPGPLLEQALALGFPVALTYGMTETASQVATAPPELVARKPGTVGPPLDGVEVAIRTEDGEPAATGEPGEVLVRGPTLSVGYRGDQALALEEGWLCTGDLGRWDEQGHLWITGRRSARIVTGGVTVDPQEVAGVLLDHVDVEEAFVVGTQDPRWGERVSAAVVLYRDAQADADALQAHCRTSLSGPKLPRAFAFVDQLPRNANGKVDRQAVQALFEQ